MPSDSSLRGLARQLEELARAHPEWSRVSAPVTVLTGYITALARVAELAQDEAKAHQVLTFSYTNWRGQFETRHVRPLTIRWGTSDWYTEPGWLLSCWDLDRNDIREFSLSKMSNVVQQNRVGL